MCYHVLTKETEASMTIYKTECPCCGRAIFVTSDGLVFRTRAEALLPISDALYAVLDDYYRRRTAGERVKLIDLAREAGVNYGSLRQLKIRYDIKNRYNKNSHAPSSTGPP
jgi:hypothetical protein